MYLFLFLSVIAFLCFICLHFVLRLLHACMHACIGCMHIACILSVFVCVCFIFSSGDGPIALILAPTRELVEQIRAQCRLFASPSKINHAGTRRYFILFFFLSSMHAPAFACFVCVYLYIYIYAYVYVLRIKCMNVLIYMYL